MLATGVSFGLFSHTQTTIEIYCKNLNMQSSVSRFDRFGHKVPVFPMTRISFHFLDRHTHTYATSTKLIVLDSSIQNQTKRSKPMNEHKQRMATVRVMLSAYLYVCFFFRFSWKHIFSLALTVSISN